MQMSYDESILGNALGNLTIELDDVVESGSTPHTSLSSHLLPHIGSPRIPSDVVIFVPDSVTIKYLSDEAKAIVISQLQLPGYSSMKNWESLGAAMGLRQDEMMSLSRQGGMSYSLMYRINNRPINLLLNALVTISRVDTLSSLRPYLMDISTRLIHYHSLESISSTSTVSHVPIRDRVERIEELIREGNPFILLINLERNRNEKKTWRHFLKNMKAKGAETNVDIAEISDALDGEDHFIRRLEQLYSTAYLVVVCVSKSYSELVRNKMRREQRDDMILMMHDWMMAEHMNRGHQNRRFRVVLMGEECVPADIPMGWSAATLWYTFPLNWNRFVERTFYTISS